MSTSPELELVNYGAGLAWLRPEVDTAIRDTDQVHQDLARLLRWPEPRPEERRYALTQAGRDYLARQRAMAALFGRPWPTLAEAHRIGICPACHQLQTAPSCATREHRGC